MLLHVLHALREAGLTDAVVVLGPQGDRIREAIEAAPVDGLTVRFACQAEPRGTGHALLQARDAARGARLLVTYGDHPLLTADQVRAVAAVTAAPAAVGTIEVDDPTGLGRIIRDEQGRVEAIVQESDCSAAQRAIREIDMSLFAFEAAWLWDTLATLPPAAGGEIYLTDVVGRAAAIGPDAVAAVPVAAPDGRISVDTRRHLARAEGILRRRIQERWLDSGVTIVDPATTYIDADVRIGADTVLEPGSHLRGRSLLGSGCRIGPNAIIRDSAIGDEAVLSGCTVEGSRLAARVRVGSYSTLRPGCVLEADVHIGTHAELKNAHLHQGVKVGHFSYLGDAEVGAETNIGAGAITCNYDGTRKHRTVIGARAFIGSDSLLIAPVEIGDGACTGAGAVVTKSVGPGERVIGHPARAVRAGRRERGE